MLICGYGNIGKHICKEFEAIADSIGIYDPFVYPYSESSEDFKQMKWDIAFICVPTEMKEDGSCDTHIVEGVLGEIDAEIYVIKSTVPVGTCRRLAKERGKRIVFSPEYYGTTIHALESPDFLVLSGEKADCDKVADLYHKVKGCNFTIRFTDYETAELAKYMENCFLGLKVTFCAEFAQVCERLGISYNDLREIFVSDPRMGKSHTYIDPKKPYYDSHCLNKDIPAFIMQCEEGEGVLMKAVNKINLEKKELCRV